MEAACSTRACRTNEACPILTSSLVRNGKEDMQAQMRRDDIHKTQVLWIVWAMS